jgi:DNA-binding transcriptional MerR regulator
MEPMQGRCHNRLPIDAGEWNMRCTRILALAFAGIGATTYGLLAAAQTLPHAGMMSMAPPAADARELVRFPEPMRLHTIASMRDHLLSLQEIDEALARNEFDKAATIAEQRLGMSSLEAHDAAHLAPFMPKGMQEIGTQMHQAASRFAIEAQNASVGNDVRPALAALGTVMQQCVACHATYRLH